nr:MAG TPA: hypothetical protein [Caudoviricetes sp.]
MRMPPLIFSKIPEKIPMYIQRSRGPDNNKN